MFCSTKDFSFQSIDYSKPEVIQALLRFYHDFKSQAKEEFDEELICVYVDIDTALRSVFVTDRQVEALVYYMEGWTEEEIGALMGGITHQAVHKLVMKVCEKVSRYLSKEGRHEEC